MRKYFILSLYRDAQNNIISERFMPNIKQNGVHTIDNDNQKLLACAKSTKNMYLRQKKLKFEKYFFFLRDTFFSLFKRQVTLFFSKKVGNPNWTISSSVRVVIQTKC